MSQLRKNSKAVKGHFETRHWKDNRKKADRTDNINVTNLFMMIKLF